MSPASSSIAPLLISTFWVISAAVALCCSVALAIWVVISTMLLTAARMSVKASPDLLASSLASSAICLALLMSTTAPAAPLWSWDTIRSISTVDS